MTDYNSTEAVETVVEGTMEGIIDEIVHEVAEEGGVDEWLHESHQSDEATTAAQTLLQHII